MHRSSYLAAALCAAAIGASAHAAVLYTTLEDFAQWVPTTTLPSDILVKVAAPTSLDSSTTNGVGNTTAAGGAGTSGSLAVSEQNANNFQYFYGPNENNNLPFLNALGVTKTGTAINGAAGSISFVYTPPTSVTPPGGAYFQLNLVLNYSGNFGQFNGGTTVDNGNGSFTRTVPYTINAVANLGYFQVGLIYNTNYGVTATPTTIDNIQGAGAPVPEPTTLAIVGAGALAAVRRRRA